MLQDRSHKKLIISFFIAGIMTYAAREILGGGNAAANTTSPRDYPDYPMPAAYARPLPQGWTPVQRSAFYRTPQGSHLIPYTWFLTLEQAQSTLPFNTPSHLSRYGLVFEADGKNKSPDHLPVGFVKDSLNHALRHGRQNNSPFTDDLYGRYGDWLGITCAACHTANITYKGAVFRVDGGQAQFDLQRFMEALAGSLETTAKDKNKLARFIGRLGKETASARVDRTGIVHDLEVYTAWIRGYLKANYGNEGIRYGFGRVDGYGAIFNRVTSTFTGIQANDRPANAPVSYPFLWGTTDLQWVQWNGSANNHLHRNIGQVLGVFGYATKPDENGNFTASVKTANLIRLQALIDKLRSPRWEDTSLPPVNRELAEQGKRLFARNCRQCHGMRNEQGKFPQSDFNSLGYRFTRINMIPLDTVNTDPLAVMNFLDPEQFAAPGAFRKLLPPAFRDAKAVPKGIIVTALADKIVDTYINNPGSNGVQEQPVIKHVTAAAGGPNPPNLMAYKARPLTGIWATAPYLHNGSVASLYQLLLPENERRTSFYLGGTEFDPINVGFVSTPGSNRFLFKSSDSSGKPIAGNSNRGHSGPHFTSTMTTIGHWRNYTDRERRQLVEFMKTL